MDKCCFDGCFNNYRWVCVKDGRIIGYYCDKHMTYLALKEEEFREKSLKEVLEEVSREEILERVVSLLVLGKSID